MTTLSMKACRSGYQTRSHVINKTIPCVPCGTRPAEWRWPRDLVVRHARSPPAQQAGSPEPKEAQKRSVKLGLLEQSRWLGGLAEGPPTDGQRMSRLDGVETTAGVKYRQFEPSWWELAGVAYVRGAAQYLPRYFTPDIPTRKRGEESGNFPRLSLALGVRSSVHVSPHLGAQLGLAQRGRVVPVRSRLCHRHHAVTH